MFVDKRGIRAEHAEIVRIAPAESCWPDEETLADAKQLLYERYRIPIIGLAEVPKTTSEERDKGPYPRWLVSPVRGFSCARGFRRR